MLIGIFSDIHEDYQSLSKAILLLEKKGVNELICLGDIVGYSVDSFNYRKRRNAAKCISAVRENCSVAVAGNHDLFAIRKIPKHNAGFKFSDDWYMLDFDERKRKGENQVWLYEETELSAMLSQKDRAYLESLPETAIISAGDSEIFFSHYLYPDVTGSHAVFKHGTPDRNQLHLQHLIRNNCTIGFSGHGHIEGVLCIDGNGATNPGFSCINIESFPQAFVGPALAEGKKKSGYLIFNSDEMTLDCFSLCA